MDESKTYLVSKPNGYTGLPNWYIVYYNEEFNALTDDEGNAESVKNFTCIWELPNGK